jgi:hypothetical protein
MSMHESEESFCSFKSIAQVQLLLYSLVNISKSTSQFLAGLVVNIPVLVIEIGRNSEEKGQGAVYLKCWDSVFEILKKMVGHVT